MELSTEKSKTENNVLSLVSYNGHKYAFIQPVCKGQDVTQGQSF